ncbi:transcriptional regulator [Helicobacter pylori]|uniref:Transcriptional regulator n=1 Tax=Helicobacter pylori TaxID=210 RepID=A0AB36KD63_HELPX|nr:transcriptional regulator [Helicobacter pylori]MCQ2901668.1 transcriptional regulator [Helicobacter pylori]OOP96428.1 transcriptional regulator [Helicobacter pylori]WQR84752.1 transcriptional regulator [Helicobacter pylori]WQU56489.1 transcriptional regulator [Helicobacter pylori]WRF66437.1 transcriptional regulator [Helicobacter pylori]
MIAWSFLKREFVVATPHFNRFYHQKFMFSRVVKIQRYAIFK